MVKKYITSGKGLDSLFIEINRKISRKEILNAHFAKIDVRKVGTDIQWELIEKCKATPNGKKYSGITWKRLEKKLDNMFKENELSFAPDVLCLASIDGNTAKYLIIDTPDPENLKKGNIHFETMDVYADDYEKTRILETRLALYDGHYIYPITQLAKLNIGKMLDAIASFKHMSEIPIGEAMLITEKLYETRILDAMYEENRGRVIRPLLSVCSRKYGGLSQKDFIERMLVLIQKNGFAYSEYGIEWSIENGITTVDVTISALSTMHLNYEPFFRITTSSLPGTSNRVELLGKVGNGYILLASNSHYSNNVEVDDLLDGMADRIYKFDEKINYRRTFERDDYESVRKIIGKKRTPESFDTENQITSLNDFVSDTWRELPPKQSYTLMKLYADIADKKIAI